MARATKFDPGESLALQDIALWTTALTRPTRLEANLDAGDCTIQSMRGTSANVFTTELDGFEGPVEVLRAYVTFGVRAVPKSDDSAEAFYTFEATYAIDYVIQKMPAEKDLADFVAHNCVHNAWPFWRQHVYDTLKRASLPVPTIPLFSGKSGKRRVARSSKP